MKEKLTKKRIDRNFFPFRFSIGNTNVIANTIDNVKQTMNEYENYLYYSYL